MLQKSKQKSRSKPQMEDYAFPSSPQPQLLKHYAQFRDDEPAIGSVLAHPSASERKQRLDEELELVKQEKEKLALNWKCSIYASHTSNSPNYIGTLDNAFQLRLPGIDRLREFIISKGSGCYVYKKDLKRTYRQFPIDPKIINISVLCGAWSFVFWY